jgi:flavin reductase (DIM6/NTAB) family NADH-FMN oxidoreductase RutF
MANKFRNVDPAALTDNVFKLLDKDWMLIAAGTMKSFNVMTASWGGLGILWGKKVAMCVIRPGRHTFGFVERHGVFTLTFYEEEYRSALNLCGSKSGRDIDKAKETGLTPEEGPNGGIYFNEARLVLECRKLYWHDIDPKHFVDPKLDANYPGRDYHRMYVGEIAACMAR